MGRTSRIADEVRLKVITKHAAGLGHEEIAAHLLISVRSVKRFITFFNRFGTVSPVIGVRGRKRNLSRDDLAFLLALIEERPDLYIDKLRDKMEEYLGRSLSVS